MKTTFKTNAMGLRASLMLIFAALLTPSCGSSGGGDAEHNFSVLPQTASIVFAADGTTSSPTVFTVETTYPDWNIDHDEWIVVTKSANGFSVSIKEFNYGDVLTGRITVKSGGTTINIDVTHLSMVTPKADLGTGNATADCSLVDYDGAIHYISKTYGEWWKYDIVADKWSRQPDLPLVNGVCGFAINGKLYIAGIEPVDDDSNLAIMRYDAASSAWVKVATQRTIHVQADLKFVIGDKAYINTPAFGFFAFNAVTEKIEPLDADAAKYPRNIYGSYNGKGYAGQKTRGLFMCEYDPATDTWIDGIASFSSYSDQMYFIDGSRLFYIDAAGVVNMYDLEEKTTVKYDKAVVTPAKGATAVVVDGTAYILGGGDERNIVKTMYEITLP